MLYTCINFEYFCSTPLPLYVGYRKSTIIGLEVSYKLKVQCEIYDVPTVQMEKYKLDGGWSFFASCSLRNSLHTSLFCNHYRHILVLRLALYLGGPQRTSPTACLRPISQLSEFSLAIWPPLKTPKALRLWGKSKKRKATPASISSRQTQSKVVTSPLQEMGSKKRLTFKPMLEGDLALVKDKGP